MPIEILMPALSPTMTEGTLAKWLKKEGDKIKSGEVIAEIETDKATMEVEAVDEGVLGKIVIPGGTEGVAVNQLIAVLLEEGEDKSAVDALVASKGEVAGGAAPVADKSEQPAPKGGAASAPAAAPASASAPAHGERVFASPLAKRIAEQQGIDLSGVSGTGPHGRIIRADVEEAAAGGGAKRTPAGTPVAASFGRNPQEVQEIPLSTMRKVIAKRLLESKQTIPHFYLSVDCRVDSLLEARTRMNAAAPGAKEGKPAFKLTVNDFVIKAVAMALRDVPAANASWADTVIHQFTNVDVSVAVAIDGGLITPIVRNADQKSLSQISREMKDLAFRARENKLKPEEFQGGGFSISNLGMYGIKQFQAIVNPPQSAILAVGSSEERVVVVEGEMQIATIMNVTLSSDHRVVDGAVGAEFLVAFKRYIEEPVLMLA